MISCQIMPMDSPFLFPLPCHDSLSLDRTQDLDLTIYISRVPPFLLIMTSSLGQSSRI